jgi:hypothetical protein
VGGLSQRKTYAVFLRWILGHRVILTQDAVRQSL